VAAHSALRPFLSRLRGVRHQALEWRDFGYAPTLMCGFAGMMLLISAWMYITAEIELQKHGHGTLGSMAIREGGFGITRHPQYYSFLPFMCGVGILMDRYVGLP
jgi:protein-S-isoprenylcysteine O-methyltransferase Ste14